MKTKDLIIHMHHVSWRNGGRDILPKIDWTVKKGEHWDLSG